jgi:hypothetical protein
MERIMQRVASTVIGVALVTLAGCASITSLSSGTWGAGGSTSQASARPIPRVQDCAVLNTGTPSRFACNGKVYTSFELAKLRENEAKKYASGQ